MQLTACASKAFWRVRFLPPGSEGGYFPVRTIRHNILTLLQGLRGLAQKV
jgi:hypothetical protein